MVSLWALVGMLLLLHWHCSDFLTSGVAHRLMQLPHEGPARARPFSEAAQGSSHRMHNMRLRQLLCMPRLGDRRWLWRWFRLRDTVPNRS